jgi:hypothetical protein
MPSVNAWWQARPELAHIEDLGAASDYASFRLNQDVRANLGRGNESFAGFSWNGTMQLDHRDAHRP